MAVSREKEFPFAAKETKVSKHACVGAEHIFLGLLLEGDGGAGRVLRNLGLSSETTREEIARELGRSRCDTQSDTNRRLACGACSDSGVGHAVSEASLVRKRRVGCLLHVARKSSKPRFCWAF